MTPTQVPWTKKLEVMTRRTWKQPRCELVPAPNRTEVLWNLRFKGTRMARYIYKIIRQPPTSQALPVGLRALWEPKVLTMSAPQPL